MVALRPAVFDCHVLALDEAGFFETLPKRGHKVRGVPGRCRVDKTNHRHRRLLRVRGERPSNRTAEKRDEFPPPHSMTSSAVVSSEGGTVRPNIRAVSALMTSSNFVACTTGKSAGFSPLRLPTTKPPTA